MGYTTNFEGVLKLNKQLTTEDKEYLEKFANTRRMARDIEGFGIDGEFYVDGDTNGFDDPTVINVNVPPRTQPGLWCQWEPTYDGWGIEWNGGEKFYDYVEWLEYLIKMILAPKGYVLNGTIKWFGEDSDDMGRILVKDNKVTTEYGTIVYKERE